MTIQTKSTLDHCKICGAALNDLQREYAHRKLYPITCGEKACNQKDIVLRHGCCEKATLLPCVCFYAFRCPVHGDTHIGTHD